MAEQKDKIFIGKTKRINFANGGHVDNLNIPQDQIEEHLNEDGWLNLQIFEKKDGSGIYAVLNTYKPKK